MDIFTIRSSGIPADARVLQFRGSEALSRPYVFDVHFTVAGDEEVDLADALHAKTSLFINRSDGAEPVAYHGVLASVRLVRAVRGNALYLARIVPSLWLLSLSKHSRVFTKRSIPDIITWILEENGFGSQDFELNLDGKFADEAHVCQYKESDLDFIHRWMEREGMYYYFEHGESSEKLVIVNLSSMHGASRESAVRYHPVSGSDRSAGQYFGDFACQHDSLPSGVTLTDYDYGRPQLAMRGVATVSRAGLGEVALYGNRFFTPPEGERLARIRAEEFIARGVVYHATGTALSVRSGYHFEVEEHPRGSFNRAYLAVEVHHFGYASDGGGPWGVLVKREQDEPYWVEVRAIASDVQYRHPQHTPWPRIDGYENAAVDGPASSQYAQIDAQGRYAIKFKFDEGSLKEGKASTYVRMMQPHGGSVEGFHFPLRKGTEVICSFMGGDPDRPVIVGVVPNAATPSPVIATNHTQNIIQTGGENYITIEDHSGAQYINVFSPVLQTNLYLGAGRSCGPHGLTRGTGPDIPPIGPHSTALGPFAFDLRTDLGSGQIHTASNLRLHSGATLQIEAGGPTVIYNNATVNWDVAGNVETKYNGTLLYDVMLAATENYHNTLNLTVTEKTTNVHNNGLEVTVNAALTKETFNVGHEQYVKAGQKIDVQGGQNIKVQGNQTIDVTADKTEKTHGNVKWDIDSNLAITCVGEHKIDSATWWETTWGKKGEFIGGAKTETILGIKNENILGIVNANMLALTNENHVGGKIETFLGVSLTLGVGVQLELSTLSSHTVMINNTNAMTKLTALSYRIEAAAAAVLCRGITVMS